MLDDTTATIEELKKTLKAFVDERDWQQFHTPKDLAIAISTEASEILEHFRFRNGEDLKKHITTHRQEIGYELADVFTFLIRLAEEIDVDLAKAVIEKMKINQKRFPIEESKGRKWLEAQK